MTADGAESNYDAFISYSHGDNDFVTKLDAALRANGVRVFLDERDIRLGDLIVESVFTAIDSARAQVIVISTASVQSAWVRDEVSAGRSKSIESDFRVIPVLIEAVELPTTVRHLKYLNLTSWRTDFRFREGVSSILHSLGRSERTLETNAVTWALRYLSELYSLERKLRDGIGYLRGGVTELVGRSPGRDDGLFSYKLYINDCALDQDLTQLIRQTLGSPQDFVKDNPSVLRPRLSHSVGFVAPEAGNDTDRFTASVGGIDKGRRNDLMHGLALMRFFVIRSAAAVNDPRVDAFQESINRAIKYLVEKDAHENISMRLTRGLEDLPHHLEVIAESLSQIVTEAIRVGIPGRGCAPIPLPRSSEPTPAEPA